MAIELRICGNEFEDICPTLEETIAFLQKAQKYIDLVNISGGTITSLHGITIQMPSYFSPHLCFAEYAREIRKHLDIPVAVVGGITCVEEAEKVVSEGIADIALMCKPLIADQALVTKAERGQEDTIRPCLRCYECCKGPSIGGQVRCAVNPRAGREEKYAFPTKSLSSKKALVVGGGTAGMTAVQVLAERGHDVILCERDSRLGGRLYEASALSYKDGFRKYIDWQIRATISCGADVRLNTEVDGNMIRSIAPDIVVLAVGADHAVPSIPGINGANVINVSQADLRQAPIGKRVVICGAGLSGSECGLDLAIEGHDVTLVDMLPEKELCLDCMNLIRQKLFELLDEYGVKKQLNASVVSIETGCVIIRDKDGQEKRLDADTVVTAFGLRSRRATVDMLRELIPETYVVGDCQAVGNIFSANHSAFNMAVEI